MKLITVLALLSLVSCSSISKCPVCTAGADTEFDDQDLETLLAHKDFYIKKKNQ